MSDFWRGFWFSDFLNFIGALIIYSLQRAGIL